MNHEELVTSLKKLKLMSMAVEYTEVARQCEKANKTHEQYLACLVARETDRKRRERIKRRVKEAMIPVPKTIEAYDFSCRKGITAQQMQRMMTCDYIRRAGNVVLYGGFGVGKSHLATVLTVAACENGYRALFMSTQAMVTKLVEAHKTLSLASLFKKLDRFDLITLDELGYSAQTPEGADLFFQLISQRYERKSLAITTNLPYSEWESVFLNPMATAAAVDRIIHNCETYNITGPSWRAEEAKRRAAKQ
jgi:DNA replication protein DnaC